MTNLDESHSSSGNLTLRKRLNEGADALGLMELLENNSKSAQKARNRAQFQTVNPATFVLSSTGSTHQTDLAKSMKEILGVKNDHVPSKLYKESFSKAKSRSPSKTLEHSQS